MTLDTTPEPAASTTPTTGDGGADAPTKPARRSRRATSAPKTAAEAPAVEALDAVGEPAAVQAAPADEAPTRPARRTRKKAAPAATLDEAVAAEVTVAATPAPAAAEVTDEAPTKPARRRATRSTAAAAPAGTEAAPAPVAEVVPASAPAAEQAATDPVPAAAPKRRRATRATASAAAPVAPAAPVVEAAAPVTPVVEPSAPAQVAEEPAASAAPARRSRRVTRPAAPALNPFAVPAPVEDLVHEVEEDEVEEDEEEVAETTAPVATAPAAGRLDVLAELGATQPAQPAKATSPARRQERGPQAPTGDQGRGTARLATTALLFQAPETRPRRRRASAPSGSPEAISAAAHAAEVEAAAAAEQEAAAPAVEQEQAPSTSSRRSRGRRGSRGGRAAEQDAVLAEQVAAVEDVEEIDAAATVGDATDAADATVEVEVTDESVEDGADDQDGDERDEDEGSSSPRRRRRRGGRGRRSRTGGEDATGDEADAPEPAEAAGDDADESDEGDDRSDEDATGEQEEGGSSRRRRRRRRSGRGGDGDAEPAAPSRSRSSSRSSDEPTALRGSTRLEAKRQRRREGRDAGRRRQIITEAEFLARREAVERSMVVREAAGLTQIAVLEDGVLVEHYVSRQAAVSMAGNVYLGRVQNVLPSMEAAFVDVGKGRNAVLYAGEVNWDAAGVEGGQPRRIEQALKSGDPVLVQVTKDPIGHKGARLTSQITLAGRYLVYVPGGGMTGISRKLPENERARLKKILREVVPDSAGVIVRTAAEGASEEELRADIARLQGQWEAIEKKSRSASAPALLQGEPDMAIRVVRDIFNDDFSSLVVQGDEAWDTISGYIGELAPDLAEKVTRWTGQGDVFSAHRVDEQLAKGMDRKVYLPSGGSLVIDRTEAMTVIDVNTGKFTGVGGTLEETVTRNNIEAAEEIVRQLRLRDIGGIIVIDFIDMVLESNRDLVLRRLVECLGRDRTKHQVAEVTSLGLVQMTRKRVGQGLVEAFSETCEHCNGRGFIVHTDPVEKHSNPRPEAGAPQQPVAEGESKRARRKRGATKEQGTPVSVAPAVPVLPEAREAVKATLATIAAAAAHAHVHDEDDAPVGAPAGAEAPAAPPVVVPAPVVAAVVEAVPAPQTAEEAAPVVQAEPVAPARAPRRRASRAAGRAQGAPTPAAGEPVLDVFAALGDLAAPRPAGQDPAARAAAADAVEPKIALSPVDPGLFELGDGGSDEADEQS